jgi:hypothetical protein
VLSYTEGVISAEFNMCNEECIIVMSAGRKVKQFLTTKETLRESTETICIIYLS